MFGLRKRVRELERRLNFHEEQESPFVKKLLEEAKNLGLDVQHKDWDVFRTYFPDQYYAYRVALSRNGLIDAMNKIKAAKYDELTTRKKQYEQKKIAENNKSCGGANIKIPLESEIMPSSFFDIITLSPKNKKRKGKSK